MGMFNDKFKKNQTVNDLRFLHTIKKAVRVRILFTLTAL